MLELAGSSSKSSLFRNSKFQATKLFTAASVRTNGWTNQATQSRHRLSLVGVIVDENQWSQKRLVIGTEPCQHQVQLAN